MKNEQGIAGKQPGVGKRLKNFVSKLDIYGAVPPVSPNRRPGSDAASPKRCVIPARTVGEDYSVLDVADESCFSAEAFRVFYTLIHSGCSVSLGLSGGSTPRPMLEMFQNLSPSCRKKVDWRKIFIFLVDERYVPIDDPSSNQRMLRETIVESTGIPEDNLCFPDTSLPYEHCVEDYDGRLQKFLKFGAPDLVVLGMGEDGHTASWFPPMNNEDIIRSANVDSFVQATSTTKFDVPQRITVSMHLITDARQKLLLLKGAKKIDRFLEIDTGDFQPSEPISQVIHSGGLSVIACPPLHVAEVEPRLTIVVFGASGDLAKKKTYPALFHLFCEGMLPRHTRIVGFARSAMSLDDFWEKHVEAHLRDIECSYYCKNAREDADLAISLGFLDKFRQINRYLAGSYASEDSLGMLDSVISSFETGSENNRLFYLALPPSVFAEVVHTARQTCWSSTGWNRVVVEKPFGRDSESSLALSLKLQESLKEDEIYRIDHFLGKEMALNLTTLRFANSFFSPLFHRFYVAAVRVTFKENIGTMGRGGYFDEFGIIRDVVQNHLLQLIALLAMEKPATLEDDDVRDEKVKVLRQILPLKLEDLVVGQYTASEDGKTPGYRDDPSVKAGSRTSTFATCALFVNSERWYGVPFIIKAGKGLEERMAEIRIQLKKPPGNLLPDDLARNELVIKIQPKEAVYMKILTKEPGLSKQLQQTELDLTLGSRNAVKRFPEAYERLIYDVIQGDKQNFVRSDELAAAWDIFTPVLHELEEKNIKPIEYRFGSRGPSESDELVARHGFKYTGGYKWKEAPTSRSRLPSFNPGRQLEKND